MSEKAKDALSDAVGAGMTVEIKGKVYKVSRLNLDDIAEFEAYIRSQKLKDILKATEGMEWNERKELIADTQRQNVSEAERTIAAETIGGVRFMLYRVMKDNKGLTLENMDELVDIGNFNEVQAVVNSIGGEEAANPPSEEAETTKP